jgi:uncharacterized membrane protein
VSPAGVGFEMAAVLYLGLPCLLLGLALLARRHRREVPERRRRAALLALRGVGLGVLLVLLARPVAVSVEAGRERREVVVLVDRSRSMGFAEEGPSRFDQAVKRTRALLPELARQGYRARTLGFDASATPLEVGGSVPAPGGNETDIAGALLQAVLSAEPPPAAVVALTDGAANRTDSNQAALLALVETRTPVIAVGLGRDEGVPSLSLRRLEAPTRVGAEQSFRVSAQLHSAGGPLPAYDLLLLRNGAPVQSRRMPPDDGGRVRVWSEGFDVTEATEGLYEYAVQLRLPSAPRVVSVNTRSSVPVRVGKETEFRVLYVQGALGWDFKFIGRAVRGDRALRLTGLSRTSKHSVFRQHVEVAGELVGGFPTELAEIARYRVLVLSELKAADLTPAQQELAARFCSELGGGVLMIGGQSTFDESWRGSRLEQMLPVSLDARGVAGLDRPFHLRLTEEALRSRVFAVADDGSSARVWNALPSFSGYGRVMREKAGAVVWARHESESGEAGKRVLMASHAYGAGTVAVLAVQNFWRWRLAKESDPQAYDRFWRQLLRFLGQAGGDEFDIHLADQELGVGRDIRALVERRPRPEGSAAAPAAEYELTVRPPGGAGTVRQRAALLPGRPVELRFRAERGGVYTLAVADAGGATVATRPVEILDTDREMERTGRDMEALRQWAAATQGLAVPAEEAGAAGDLAARVKAQVEAARRAPARRRPLGMNGWVLATVLAGIGGEWALRRRWGLR